MRAAGLLLAALLASAPPAFADTFIVPCAKDLQSGRITVEQQYVKDYPGYKVLHYAAVNADGPTVSEGKCEIAADLEPRR